MAQRKTPSSPGLADWWRDAESLWPRHRSSDRLTLAEQLDFRRKLSVQLPAPTLRVVYGKAGMHVAATVVDDTTAIIDHKLYWGTVATRSAQPSNRLLRPRLFVRASA